MTALMVPRHAAKSWAVNLAEECSDSILTCLSRMTPTIQKAEAPVQFNHVGKVHLSCGFSTKTATLNHSGGADWSTALRNQLMQHAVSADEQLGLFSYDFRRQF